MKPIYYFSLLLVTLFFLLSSCEKSDYDGMYSKEGFYDAENSVYFYFPEQQDTLVHYSFATDWVEHTRQIVKIPVRVTGFPTSSPRTFRIVVDKEASSALPNKHYTPFDEQFQVLADSVNGYVDIEMWRDHLSSEKRDTVELVLRLESTLELQSVFLENKKVTILIDDYLQEPYFWIWYEYYWGPYSATKYRKFLEYYDGEPAKLEDALITDFSGLSINFLKVYEFFKAHPEYEQILPDSPYYPYQ